MERGRFITFEGGDGVGKSTQIRRLAARLHDEGIACIETREPGGTPFAERVRRFILAGDLPPHAPLAEALLFSAARVDHVGERIMPALSAGTWVLSDRFADSTRAYQGAAGGVDGDTLARLEALTHPYCQPDLTLILDLDPVDGKRRIAERDHTSDGGNDPFEGREFDFQVRLRAAFLDLAVNDPGRCRVIDAAQSVESVEAAVWQAIVERFGVGGA